METIVILIIIFIIICCCGCIFIYFQNNSNKLNHDTSLIVYYKFDVNDIQNGNVMNYATGKHDGILKSGASIQSIDYKVGNGSLLLDSSNNQYLQLPDITPDNKGLTIAYWFKINDAPGWARIFDFGNGASDKNWLQSPVYGLSVYNGNIQVLQPNTSPMVFENNTWYHSVWTLTPAAYASATSIWNYYINGEIIRTYSDGGYPQPITLKSNYIGKSNWENDPYYNGAIDDFRLYNRILSDSEIKSLYSFK